MCRGVRFPQARLDKAHGRSAADPDGARARACGLDRSATHYSSGAKHPVDALRFASVRREVWYDMPSVASRSLQGDSWLDLVTAHAHLHQDDAIDRQHRPHAIADRKPILGKSSKRLLSAGLH